jgi:hypothetical protein
VWRLGAALTAASPSCALESLRAVTCRRTRDGLGDFAHGDQLTRLGAADGRGLSSGPVFVRAWAGRFFAKNSAEGAAATGRGEER